MREEERTGEPPAKGPACWPQNHLALNRQFLEGTGHRENYFIQFPIKLLFPWTVTR
jgi:hypothetical protein